MWSGSPPFANSKSSDEKGDEEIQPNGGERKQKMKEKRYKESNAKEREEGSPKKKKKRKETDVGLVIFCSTQRSFQTNALVVY